MSDRNFKIQDIYDTHSIYQSDENVDYQHTKCDISLKSEPKAEGNQCPECKIHNIDKKEDRPNIPQLIDPLTSIIEFSCIGECKDDPNNEIYKFLNYHLSKFKYETCELEYLYSYLPDHALLFILHSIQWTHDISIKHESASKFIVSIPGDQSKQLIISFADEKFRENNDINLSINVKETTDSANSKSILLECNDNCVTATYKLINSPNTYTKLSYFYGKLSTKEFSGDDRPEKELEIDIKKHIYRVEYLGKNRIEYCENKEVKIPGTGDSIYVIDYENAIKKYQISLISKKILKSISDAPISQYRPFDFGLSDYIIHGYSHSPAIIYFDKNGHIYCEMYYHRGYLFRENHKPNTVYYYNGRSYEQYLSPNASFSGTIWNSWGFIKRQFHIYFIAPFTDY